MNKLHIWLGVLAVIIVGGIIFLNSNTEFEVVVDSEIDTLENELMALEDAIEAGELSPEEAADAQLRITARMEAINTAITNSQQADLTPAQRAQLKDALERLKQVLTNYQASLLVVEAQVETLPEAEKQRLRRGGNSHRITQVVTGTVAQMQDVVEDVVEEYDETSLDELFAENASSSEEQSEEWLEEQPTGDEDSTVEDTDEVGSEDTTSDDITDDEPAASEEIESIEDAEGSSTEEDITP